MAPEDYESFLPFQMRRFLARWDALEAAELADLKLSGLQFWTLLVVLRAGQMTVSEIADLLRIDQTTTSRTVDSLVKRELADRRISDVDLRQRIITLRPGAEAPVLACWERLKARMERIEAGFSPAQRDRGLTMMRLLATMDFPSPDPETP